jgi:hypothetical protein
VKANKWLLWGIKMMIYLDKLINICFSNLIKINSKFLLLQKLCSKKFSY